MSNSEVDKLNETLQAVQARWHAVEQPMRGSGFMPGPDDISLEARESLSKANHTAFVARAAHTPAPPAPPPPPPYPISFDWRKFAATPSMPGMPAGDYVSPVQDQGICNSCVAFGVISAIESASKIQARNPALAIDLSEADLFYCHEGVHPGPTCESSWYPDSALNICKNPGVVDDACFPYTSGDQSCNKCPDWRNRLKKIHAWRHLIGTTGIKQWIATRGPVVTCFTLYTDFRSYGSGVYHHVTGGSQIAHCVGVVGYDDVGRFWICKNSWGPGFGEAGFFRIAYGECGIDALMWGVEL